eukprot:3369680-Amphidinium_carterae.2
MRYPLDRLSRRHLILTLYRGEFSGRCCPYIYDDSSTEHDSMPCLKACMDVSAEDAGVTTKYSGAWLCASDMYHSSLRNRLQRLIC